MTKLSLLRPERTLADSQTQKVTAGLRETSDCSQTVNDAAETVQSESQRERESKLRSESPVRELRILLYGLVKKMDIQEFLYFCLVLVTASAKGHENGKKTHAQ